MNRLVFFLCFLISVMHAFAQPYKAEHICLAQGLSQSSVYSLAQDKSGFLWVGTQDGLNRYDGLNFTIYRNEPFDTASLSSSTIYSLISDNENRIWIGGQESTFSVKMPGEKTFGRYSITGKENKSVSINFLYRDHFNRILAFANDGIYQVSFIDGKFSAIPFHLPFIEHEKKTEFNTVFQDSKSKYWLASSTALYRFGIDEKKFSAAEIEIFSKNESLPVAPSKIYSIGEDAAGRIWLGSTAGPLWLDEKDGTFKSLSGNFSEEEKLIVLEFCLSSSGDLWLGTQGRGLFVARKNNLKNIPSPEMFEPVSEAGEAIGSRNYSVISLIEDQITPGIMWVGTDVNCLVKLVPVTKNFTTDRLRHPSVPSNIVNALVKDHDGTVWIGTNDGLLRKSQQKEYSVFRENKKSRQGLKHSAIVTVYKDNNHQLWIGTPSGPQRIERRNETSPLFQSFKNSDGEELNVYSRRFYESGNNLYLLTPKEIYLFNRKDHTFSLLLNLEDKEAAGPKMRANLQAMLIDKDDDLWIATVRGLFRIKSVNGKYSVANREVLLHIPTDTTSLRSNYVLSILQDSKDRIWVGTYNGLSRVIKQGEKISFRHFTSREGLSNNLVYSVLEDKPTGRLWVSTNGGLSCFNPETNLFTNYDIHDGLQSNEFNSGAYSLAYDSEMFFGGVNGYTSFYPGQISADTVIPKVFITQFMLPGNKILYPAPMNKNKTIELNHSENSFTIDFIALQYGNPVKNKYAYRLEGLHTNWIYCGTTHQVNFSELAPGKYIFTVTGSNSDGFFAPEGDSLTLIINPPFYSTIWFYVALAAVAGLFVYVLFRYRLRMKLEKIEVAEQLRKETAADLHDELGHKLTIINWFGRLMRSKLKTNDDEMKSYLDKIIETSAALYHTMKDLLWSMDPEKDSVYELYNHIREFGQEFFDQTGIEFSAGEIDDIFKNKNLPLSYKRHVLLMFKEVMHNTLKHSGCSKAWLVFENGSQTMSLTFSDNGKGLNGTSNNGQGLKNVRKRAEQIHANYEITSEAEGTSFKLMMDLKLKPEEVI